MAGNDISTGGGAGVEGDVSAGHDFIGRDRQEPRQDARNNIQVSLDNNALGRQNNEFLQSIDQRLLRMEQNIDFRFYRLEDKTEARLTKIERELAELKEDVVIVKIPSRSPQLLQNGNLRLIFMILTVISFVLALILIYIARGI